MPKNAPVQTVEVTGSDFRLLQDYLESEFARQVYGEITRQGDTYRDSDGMVLMQIVHGIYLVRPSLAKSVQKVRKALGK